MWFRIWRPDYFYVRHQRLIDASDCSPFNRGWAQGFGFFVVGCYWNEGRSVGYDGTHSPAKPNLTIVLNGDRMPITRELLSYEMVLALAGARRGASVTWFDRVTDRKGLLSAGQKVLVTDGMIFNAVMTDAA